MTSARDVLLPEPVDRVDKWRREADAFVEARERARRQMKAREQRMQKRSTARANVEALQAELAGIKEDREARLQAIGEVIGRERGDMRKHVEDAVRDLRRELLREVERLAARVKELEERPLQQPPARERGSEFKFAHERDEPVDLPKFLPAPVMRKVTVN